MSKQKVFSTNCVLVDSVREFLFVGDQRHVHNSVCATFPWSACLSHHLSPPSLFCLSLIISSCVNALRLLCCSRQEHFWALCASHTFSRSRSGSIKCSSHVSDLPVDLARAARVTLSCRDVSNSDKLTPSSSPPRSTPESDGRDCAPPELLTCPSVTQAPLSRSSSSPNSPCRLPPETLRLGLQQSMMSKLYQYWASSKTVY